MTFDLADQKSIIKIKAMKIWNARVASPVPPRRFLIASSAFSTLALLTDG
jgi:hypothetical protein